MKKLLLIALILITNFVSSQTQLSDYYDASVSNRPEFSYNVTIQIQKNEGETNDAKKYTATLIKASPDSKGYYNTGPLGDNKFYNCSQLGSVCNPNNFRLLGVTIYYSCNGQEKVTSISFRGLNTTEYIPTVLGAGGKFCESKDFTSIKVRSISPTNEGQIIDKIKQLNSPATNQNKSNTSTQNTNTANQSNTNNSIGQIPDDYKGNPLHYNNPNVNSGSSAVDSYNKGVQQGQQITEIATGLISLFSKSPEQVQREEEQRQREEERRQKEADLKANKLRLINSRKKLIAQYPDGKTPLSYQVKETTEVYFFTYSYNPETIESNSPTIYISNVFPVQKNGDGTWLFKANLMEKIAKTNPGLNLILSGYYLNKSEADIKQQQLLHEATEFGFIVNNINYVGKKSTLTSNSSTDYWGNATNVETQKTTTEKQEPKTNPTETDYWGNPIKKTNNQPASKKPAKLEVTTTKPQLDYWGNPIKQ